MVNRICSGARPGRAFARRIAGGANRIAIGYAGCMNETILSIAMIAAFVLLGGGAWLIARKRDLKRGFLMLGAAVVLGVNIWVMTLPVPG